MIQRACIVCAKPGPKSYCPEHEPKPWAASKRATKQTISGSANQKRRKRILEGYLYCCHRCGKTGTDQNMEVDHVIPLGEGGADAEHNLAPIHKDCHREKTQEEATRARQRQMIERRYR